MTEFFQCVFSSNGLAYTTGAAIFLITAFLVAKRVIGFTFTLLFLLFALAAALAIAHQDAISDYFKKTNTTEVAPTSPGESKEGAQINTDLQKTFEDLKAEFLVYKAKLEKLIKDLSEKKEEPKK